MTKSTTIFIYAFMLSVWVSASPESSGVVFAPSSTALTGQTSGSWRWLDVADQQYSATFQANYSYTDATVLITYDDSGQELTGHLSATGLKPNFAYQFKLNEWDGRPQNELIGYRGRWWQETWNGTDWGSGQNLNVKGTTGLPPNPNDGTYDSRKDIMDASDHYLYKYCSYRVFSYFITDEFGSAEVDFAINNCYHVLWKTTQRSRTANDGIALTHTFDPDPAQTAYSTDYASSSISVFGEWERLPNGRVELLPGVYDCQMALTEESFHGSGLAGGWALAMIGDAQFTILPGPIEADVSQTAGTAFPETVLGANNDLTLAIQNSGDATLSLLGTPSASFLSGGDLTQFSIVAQPPTVWVWQNMSTYVNVRYTPTTTGSHTVTVRVPTNDPDTPDLDVALTATCVAAPGASLTGESDFSKIAVGTHVFHVFTIGNTGAGPLKLTNVPTVVLTGDTEHFQTVFESNTTIEANDEAKFAIRYHPLSEGTHHAVMTIPCNDPNSPNLIMALTGRAILDDEPDRDDWRDASKCGVQRIESPLPFYVLLGGLCLACFMRRRKKEIR